MKKSIITLSACGIVLLSSLAPTLASANVILSGSNNISLQNVNEENLVKNGDFSNGSEGWQSAHVEDGFAYLNNRFNEYAQTETISVDKNSKYRLTFDLKAFNPQFQCLIEADFRDITEKFNADVNIKDGWKHFSFDVSTYDFNYLTLKFFARNSASEAGLDDVKLVKIE